MNQYICEIISTKCKKAGLSTEFKYGGMSIRFSQELIKTNKMLSCLDINCIYFNIT